MHDGEHDWWRKLLRKPNDRTAWLVFADWLQDRGDDRAEGIRAVAVLNLKPYNATRKGPKGWAWLDSGRPFGSQLTRKWYKLLAVQDERGYKTTREAIEDAARAFGKLPEDDRRRLLAGAGKV